MAVEVPKVIDPLASNLSAGAYERHRMDLGEQMTVRMKMYCWSFSICIIRAQVPRDLGLKRP